MESLVAGGAAEAFERHLRQRYRGGYRRLVVDLSGVFLLMGLEMSAGLEHTKRERA